MAAASTSVRLAGRVARSPSSGQHTNCAYVPNRCLIEAEYPFTHFERAGVRSDGVHLP